MNEPDDELDVLIRHAEATQTGWKMVHASDLRTIHAKRASLTARLARVEAENKRLREALGFYANLDSWRQNHGPRCVVAGDPEAPYQDCEPTCGSCDVHRDEGERARAALKEGS